MPKAAFQTTLVDDVDDRENERVWDDEEKEGVRKEGEEGRVLDAVKRDEEQSTTSRRGRREEG